MVYCLLCARIFLRGAEPQCRLRCASRPLPALLYVSGAAAFSAVRYFGRGRGLHVELVTAMRGCRLRWCRCVRLSHEGRCVYLHCPQLPVGAFGGERIMETCRRRGLRCFRVRRGPQTPCERGAVVPNYTTAGAARGVALAVEVRRRGASQVQYG